MSLRIVFSTAPDGEVARRIVRTLVEEHLAACGNILPGIESTYWWRGTLETTAEVMILLKTTAEQYPRLAARLQELHPYELPEIVAMEPRETLPAYLQWVTEGCSQSED